MNKVSVFRFPKDEAKKKEWLRRIPQELLSEEITDDMVVCEKHFESRFIVRDYTCQRPDGGSFTCMRDIPVLDPDAVPTLFPNTPPYLSSPLPPKRKAPNERRAEMAARDDRMLEQWLDDDCIADFEDFRTSVSQTSLGVHSDWIVVSKAEVVLFLLVINIASSLVPSIVASFKVWRDIRVDWFDDKCQRDNAELVWLLGDDIKLSRWSQLRNVCAHVQNTCRPTEETVPTDAVLLLYYY